MLHISLQKAVSIQPNTCEFFTKVWQIVGNGYSSYKLKSDVEPRCRVFLLPRKDERDVEDLEQALADIEAEIDDEKKGGANEFSAMVAESGRL